MSVFLKEKNSAAMQVPMIDEWPNLMLKLSVFCSWSDFQSLSELVCFLFFFFIENALLIVSNV